MVPPDELVELHDLRIDDLFGIAYAGLIQVSIAPLSAITVAAITGRRNRPLPLSSRPRALEPVGMQHLVVADLGVL